MAAARGYTHRWHHGEERADVSELLEQGPSFTNTVPIKTVFKRAGIGVDEINTIFKELEGQQHITVEDFVEGCSWITGNVRSTDLLHVVAGVKSMYHRTEECYDKLQALEAACDGMLETIRIFLERFEGEGLARDSTPLPKPPRNEIVKINGLSDQNQEFLIQRKLHKIETQRVWFRFDMFFLSVVFANCAILAVEFSRDKYQTAAGYPTGEEWLWCICDMVFCSAYVVEVVLRIVTEHQIVDKGNAQMYCCVVPYLVTTKHWFVHSLVRLPTLLTDPFFVMDILFTVCGLMDAILVWIVGIGVHWVLRTLQLLKVLRVLRIGHHCKPVRMLIGAFAQALPSIFWAMLLLALLVFSAALIMVALVGKDPSVNDDPTIQSRWGSLRAATGSLVQIFTFSEWAEFLANLAQNRFRTASVLLFVFLIMGGHGIMNIVTGLVVEQVFHLSKEGDEEVMEEAAAKLRNVLGDIKKQIHANKAKPEPHDAIHRFPLLSQGVTTSLTRSSVDRYSSVPRETVSQVEVLPSAFYEAEEVSSATSVTADEIMLLVENPSLLKKLTLAGLSSSALLIAFQRVDVVHEGVVNVDDYVQGLQHMVQPLQSINVAMLKSVLRRALDDGDTQSDGVFRSLECFMEIVDRLRSVQLSCVEPGVENIHLWKDAFDTGFDECDSLRRRNVKLKRGINHLQAHIKSRRRFLFEACPRARGHKGEHVPGLGDAFSDADSDICSVECGFD